MAVFDTLDYGFYKPYRIIRWQFRYKLRNQPSKLTALDKQYIYLYFSETNFSRRRIDLFENFVTGIFLVAENENRVKSEN